jgi:hypothetical protein
LAIAASLAVSRSGSMSTAVGPIRKSAVVLRLAYPDGRSGSAFVRVGEQPTEFRLAATTRTRRTRSMDQ